MAPKDPPNDSRGIGTGKPMAANVVIPTVVSGTIVITAVAT